MEDMLKLGLEIIQVVEGMPTLHAVLAGLAAGVAVAYMLSTVMDPDTETAKAKRITALVSGGLTLIVALLLDPTIRTTAWGITMALIAPAVHGALVRVVIRRWPWAAPESVLDHAEVAMVEQSKAEKIKE